MFEQTRCQSPCSRRVLFLLSLTMASLFALTMSQGAQAQEMSSTKALVVNAQVPAAEVKNSATPTNEATKSSTANSRDATTDEQLNSLRKQLADQQQQIDELRRL